MKKSVNTIGKITAMGIMLVSAYMFGTIRSETVMEAQKVTKTIEVIPDGYIALNECIPLSDIACWFMDSYDYPCFELKDVATQYNADNTRSYADIIRNLPDETEDFQGNFIDMRMVANFKTDGNGLYLYLKDGTGYYWEK